MSADQGECRSAVGSLLNPDDVESVLSGSFYSPPPESVAVPKAKHLGASAEKPSHYKVICISLYMEDLERLDEMVAKLKERGLTKANRSALIRHALALVDIDSVPRGL